MTCGSGESIVESGNYHVWSITWDDLESPIVTT